MNSSDPHSVLKVWIAALNDRNTHAAADLYAETATLYPIFSAHALRTPGERLHYFESLTTRPKIQVTLHARTLHLDQLTAAQCIVSGIYRFAFAVNGELLNFEARFPCLLDTVRARPILHHHFSQVPRGLA